MTCAVLPGGRKFFDRGPFRLQHRDQRVAGARMALA